MKAPQIIHADQLAKEWPMTGKGHEWHLARPESSGYIIDRFRLAWGVFTGRYDALKWEEAR